MSNGLVDQNGSPPGGAGSQDGNHDGDYDADHDTDLLRELHEEHASALWSYALRLTGDRSRAADVVQETLLRAWRDPRILDPDRSLQRSWLCTVARNIVIDKSPSEPVADRQLVVAALGRLTQEHRQVLRECYFRGSSVAEAANALGISPGTVKSRAYYALRALRLAIEEQAGAE